MFVALTKRGVSGAILLLLATQLNFAQDVRNDRFQVSQVWEGDLRPESESSSALHFRLKVTATRNDSFTGEIYLLQFGVESHGVEVRGSFIDHDTFRLKFTKRIRGEWMESSLRDGYLEANISGDTFSGKWIAPSVDFDGRVVGRLIQSNPKELAKKVAEKAPELSDATFDEWRDFLLPKPEELSWMNVDWRPSFWRAVVEAQQTDKPILIWSMSGNPIGCV